MQTLALTHDSSNYGGERLPIKYGQDGNILWESVTISPFAEYVNFFL